MSARGFDSAHSTLEALLKKAPRKGFKSASIINIIVRVDWIIRQGKTLYLRAQCLSRARGSCTEGKMKICDTGCASIMTAEAPDYVSVWKARKRPFSIRITPEGLNISHGGYSVSIQGTTMRIVMITPQGSSTEKTIRLDDADDVYANSDYVSIALKGVEEEIQASLRNLAQCARLAAIQCP